MLSILPVVKAVAKARSLPVEVRAMFHPDVIRMVADQRRQALVDAATKHRRLRSAARATGRHGGACKEDTR